MEDYSGIHCPIITPFGKDGAVDLDALGDVIDFVLGEQKVNGLVPCGTTGESPVLNDEERDMVVKAAVGKARGKVPVMAGAGSNWTDKSIHAVQKLDALGASSFLIVGPYYNKPMMSGIVAHYRAIAAATSKPIFVYNIPGRTSRNIEPATLLEIAKIPNVLGLKDAAGSLDQTMEVLAGAKGLGKKFYILAGDDQMVYPLMALGGNGGICAVSHVVGRELGEIFMAARRSDWDAAREIHFSILPMIKALFCESNPAPVKAALEMMGVIGADPLRLPMVPMTAAGRERLKAELKKLGKI